MHLAACDASANIQINDKEESLSFKSATALVASLSKHGWTLEFEMFFIIVDSNQ
jgi:hypothetical protein